MKEGRQDHGTMVALVLQKKPTSIGSISGKDNHYARSQNGREYLKFGICVGNDYGLVSCKNLKVEGDSEKVKAVETRCVQIEV